MLTQVLPILTMLGFFWYFHRKPSLQRYLVYVLTTLPFMDVKVVPEVYGGFRTFDLITLYAIVFNLRDFTRINSSGTFKWARSVVFGLLLILFFRSVFSEFGSSSLFVLLRFAVLFGFVRCLYIELEGDYEPLFEFTQALKKAFIFSVLFLMVQVVMGTGFTISKDLNQNIFDEATGVVRYPGIFNDSQGHGQFLAMGSFLFLFKDGFLSSGLKGKLFFFIMVMAIIVAGSRSAFAGLGLGFCVLLLALRNAQRFSVIVTVVVLFLLSPYLETTSGVFSRLASIKEDYAIRDALWSNAAKIHSQNPILGIGIGNYQKYVMKYEQDQFLEYGEDEVYYYDQPESGYYKILVEFGLVGFILFFALVAIPMIKALWRIVGPASTDSHGLVFPLAGMASWCLAFTTVYSLFDTRICIVVATYLCILAYQTRRQPEASHQDYQYV